ncbi:MAG: GWxTD domain-containing protein, partial [Bacteroidota bacterium]|nr:GWxTD domain-containing protein [Bacteroidota bacterium]
YYPNIYTPADMIYPLRYLASTKEFNKLNKIINEKLAVDNFWLSKNSNLQKAKSLIKIYYNRAMLSNLFFTSTKEGWKTDQGMIYIIFGPPGILHKADNVEEWIYSNSFSGKKKSFIFKRTVDKNKFENFVLSRNSSYIHDWKKAIEIWNKGNIYSF